MCVVLLRFESGFSFGSLLIPVNSSNFRFELRFFHSCTIFVCVGVVNFFCTTLIMLCMLQSKSICVVAICGYSRFLPNSATVIGHGWNWIQTNDPRRDENPRNPKGRNSKFLVNTLRHLWCLKGRTVCSETSRACPVPSVMSLIYSIHGVGWLLFESRSVARGGPLDTLLTCM